MRRRHPKAIVCFQDHASIVALWARGLARTSTPIVATVHNTWSQLLAHGTSKTRLLAQCVRRAYSRVESVVAVSEGAADDLSATLGLSRDDIKVIYNPVISPELLEKSREPLDHPWFSPGCPPVILGIGRLTQQKDFRTLVFAFERVRRRMICRLMILGEGEDLTTLQRLVESAGLSDDVTFPGFVQNPYKYLARSSLFVLSSLWEGLPTVLIEALALGVPVVSSDCESGPREILERGRHGKLVKPGDPEALSLAIIEALLHRPSKFTGAQRFDLNYVSRQYRSLVDQLSK
jgi:glycosyltransferase involved in cell wall biosynthesis